MTIDSDKFTRRLGIFSSLAILVIGIAGVVGWMTGIYLTLRISGIVPISPVASVAFVLIGSIMLSLVIPLKNKYAKLVAKFLCSFILVIGCMFWISAVFFPGWDVGKIIVVPLFGSSPPIETEIAPLAAFAIFLGIVPLIRKLYHAVKWRHYDTLMGGLAVAVFSIGFTSLTGYAFGTPQFFGTGVQSVSLASSFALTFFGLGIMGINGTSVWPSTIFSSNTISAQIVQVMIPLLVAAFMLYGWLLFKVIIPSFGDPVIPVAIFTAVSIALTTYVVSYISAKVQKVVEKAQAERFESIEALSEANRKLDLLDSLTRHDVMNQVSAAIVEAQILKSTNKDRQIQDSAENIEKIGSTILDMLKFSKEYRHVGVESPKWIDVKEVLSGAIKQLDATSGKVIESYCTDWRIFADPMLGKAFFNILENSIRHGEKVSNITIECIPQNEDGSLRIVISDNGVGIPEADKERIFEKGVGKNTGLGLFLVREIMSITDITIRENGVPGKGARFEITVPKGGHEAAPRPDGAMKISSLNSVPSQ